MLNSEQVYRDAGYKCGQAVRRHDAGLARHWHDFLQRAKAMEKPEDRPNVAQWFDAGYKEAQPAIYR